MNFDLQVLSSFSGWEQLAQTGMSFGTNLLAALAIFFIGRWVTTRVVTLMKTALTRAKVDKTLVSFLGQRRQHRPADPHHHRPHWVNSVFRPLP